MSVASLAETGVAIALAAVLSLIRVKLPHLIYGGSVSLHSLPLFLVALRHGPRAGVLAGAAYGFVNFAMTPYFVHPVQLALDYPVAFGVLGLAGLSAARASQVWIVISAVVAASGLRMASHVVSGIVYFGDLAPEGTSAWKYSLAYNASYLVPETILAAIATAVLVRRLPLRATTN